MYKGTEKIRELFEEKAIYFNLRERYIKLPFGHRKAVKCTREMSKYHNLAWKEVYNLYPELNGKQIRYDTITNTLEVTDERNNI